MGGGSTPKGKNLLLQEQILPFKSRVTGCRFVQVADSYTWSFQACTSFTMSIKKKLITQAIKQATVSAIFS